LGPLAIYLSFLLGRENADFESTGHPPQAIGVSKLHQGFESGLLFWEGLHDVEHALSFHCEAAHKAHGYNRGAVVRD
jgi:hypothetical protein